MFKNLHELILQMPDEKACREYLIKERWNGEPECPYCGHKKAYVIEGGKRFKCASNACYKKFSITVGTIFEASNIPLQKWFMAMYLCTAHKKGVSSYQIAKNIGVTQKTAWFMLHRFRELMRAKKKRLLKNTVEADITYLGGKMANKSNAARKKYAETVNKNPIEDKTGVLGITERQGDTILQVVPNKGEATDKLLRESVEYASSIITDEGGEFRSLNDDYYHYTVNHSKREYARWKFHTNSIEGVFSHLKRMQIGTYHHFSTWHTPAYLDEFEYRWNTRGMTDPERMAYAISHINCRLTYKALVARNTLSLRYEAPKE